MPLLQSLGGSDTEAVRPSLIISGLQTGADQGGLRAAVILGIPTGGYAPKGYYTEAGYAPDLGRLYSLMEHETEHDYAPRTEANVRLADATVICGKRSRGSNLTESLCKRFGKPWVWISHPEQAKEHLRFKLWLARTAPEVLNVAGNRESVNPGIGKATEMMLVKVLRKV